MTSWILIINTKLDHSKGENYGPSWFLLSIEKFTRHHEQFLRITMDSIDDFAVRLVWNVKEMYMKPHEAEYKLRDWLQRSNYFVNFKELECFCELFGPITQGY